MMREVTYNNRSEKRDKFNSFFCYKEGMRLMGGYLYCQNQERVNTKYKTSST